MTESPKRVVILGATSAIAQAAARIWAGQGARLVLVGRNEERLEAIAADLKARGAAQAEILVADCAEAEPTAALSRMFEMLGGLDVVLLAYGVLGDQAQLERDPAATADLLRTNFTSAAAWCQAVAATLERAALRRPAGDRFGGGRSRTWLQLRVWRLQGGSRRARARHRAQACPYRRPRGPDQAWIRGYADDRRRREEGPALGAAGGRGANDRRLR